MLLQITQVLQHSPDRRLTSYMILIEFNYTFDKDVIVNVYK
jgi:hypothetical protein